MQYRILGKTREKVSVLSYGTGGPSQFGQKTGVDNKGRSRLINVALDNGINLFDTAPSYANSEELLGKALKGINRDSYLIATKVSTRNQDLVARRDSIGEFKNPLFPRKSLERSLKKLNVDHIDIFQFHGLANDNYDDIVECFLESIIKAREEGLIKYIGITENLVKEPKHSGMVLALEKHPDIWDTIMLKYGIMNQWAAKNIFPIVQKKDIGILNMAPVRLTLTNNDRLLERFNEWRLNRTDIQGTLEDLKSLNNNNLENSEELISKGYAFAASHDCVSTIITGSSNEKHLKDNIKSANSTIDKEIVKKIIELFGNSDSID